MSSASKFPHLPAGMSVVDPAWETIDPSPDIHQLFLIFNDIFFYGTLAGIEVKWSKRMTLCAGLCSFDGQLCSVRLSEPLLKFRPRADLINTLLHEMIHAYLFLNRGERDRESHGPNFLKHMQRINDASGSNITVYHTFHDEVDKYRVHWWQCNGPCQSRQPYFGLVKRAVNRAPGPSDYWWSRHQSECGGTYIKIREPEPKEKAKRKRKKEDEDLPRQKPANNLTIEESFARIKSKRRLSVKDEQKPSKQRTYKRSSSRTSGGSPSSSELTTGANIASSSSSSSAALPSSRPEARRSQHHSSDLDDYPADWSPPAVLFDEQGDDYADFSGHKHRPSVSFETDGCPGCMASVDCGQTARSSGIDKHCSAKELADSTGSSAIVIDTPEKSSAAAFSAAASHASAGSSSPPAGRSRAGGNAEEEIIVID